MKTTYIKFIFIIVLLINGSLFSQVSTPQGPGAKGNKLTQSEFESVSFGTVTLKQLMEAKADVNIVNTLFPNMVNGLNNTSPFLLKYFENSNIYFSYLDETDTGNQFN